MFKVVLHLSNPNGEMEFEVPNQFEDDLLKWLEWVEKLKKRGGVKNGTDG
jgi:hypothetical protein